MGKLVFIGLGLHDEKGITLGGLEAARACDTLFMETYTSTLSGSTKQDLEALYEKEIIILDREKVEDGSIIIEAAKSQNVGFLVPGDAMSATTHVDLRLRAEKEGIRTEIIHGVSALTAIPGLLGLQHYKFGKVTTIPFWEGDYRPDSFYDVVKDNRSLGLHTLMLLDIQADKERCLTATDAFKMLVEIEKDKQEGIFGPDRLVCVVARAGARDVALWAGHLQELKNIDFGPPLHSIVVPGELHFMEEEALERLGGIPKL